MNRVSTEFHNVEFDQPSAAVIGRALFNSGLSISRINPIPFGMQLRLGCGVVINVFDSGCVFVQGKVRHATPQLILNTLKQLLPQDTRWGL